MKLLFTLFAAALMFTACNSTDKAEEAKQDSIAEVAAADSMLNSAMEADTTLKLDTVTVDSIQ